MDADDLLATAEALYGGAPADFTAMRNSSAASAKKAGAPDLAAALRSLTKPTAAAHALNRLVRAHPEGLSRIAAVRSRIEEAAAAGDRDALRETARERHELVARLVDDARTAVSDEGGSLSAAASDEVADALGAALGDSLIADAMATGRLSTAPRAGGMTRQEIRALVALPPAELGSDGDAQDDDAEEDDAEEHEADDASEDTRTPRGGGAGRRRVAAPRRTSRGGAATTTSARGVGPGSAERSRIRRELAAAEEADREAREDRRRREADRDRIVADRAAQEDEVRRRRDALRRAERELDDLNDRADALTADIRSRVLEWKRAEAALRRARRAADDIEAGDGG